MNQPPVEGKGLCSASQSPCVHCILITAGGWCELGLGGGGWSPSTPLPPSPWPRPVLSRIEMGCWQPLGEDHSVQGPGSQPALCLPLALGLIVSRWQMPFRQGSGLERGWDSRGGSRSGWVSPPPLFYSPLPWLGGWFPSGFGVMLHCG